MKKDVPYKNSLLVYHVYGSGVPVVLLHGFGETNSVCIGTEDRAASLNALLKEVHLPEIAYIHIIPDVAHMNSLRHREN